MTQHRTTPRSRRSSLTLETVCRVLDSIAPPALAQDWDNVGLLTGDLTDRVRRVLCCIDLTEPVADEARAERADLILAYHPPLFRPIQRLRTPSTETDAVVYRCIRHGMAIYATHTALDAADGGTNDVIAGFVGIEQTEPIEHVPPPGDAAYKLVTFVPQAQERRVLTALFAAGAGVIGDYTHCSFKTPGTGTFLGSETTHPAVGQPGRLETVDELRIEVVVPDRALPDVVRALRRAHPYEEPAFDIYPTRRAPVRGIGRVGTLPRPLTLAALARKLGQATRVAHPQIVGRRQDRVRRAIILVGAAGSIPFRLAPGPGDVIITGEIRHHDALSILRRGCCAIALGHWASERPVLQVLASRLRERLPNIDIRVSQADRDPFNTLDC